MAKAPNNISQSPRLQQQDFSETTTSFTLGPGVKPATVNGEAVEMAASEIIAINQWVAMTTADQGLLDAIYNFINTTKEGISIPPDTTGGRTKKIYFNFYGGIGKSIMPGEIGQFEVNFSYAAKTKIGAGSPVSPAPVTVSNRGLTANVNPRTNLNL